MDPQLRVKDADRVIRAFKKVETQLPKDITAGLRLLGREVQQDARARFAPYSPATAAKYRVRVSKIGRVSVENPLKKTTGLHPEWGELQMRVALVPALQAKEEIVRHGIEALIAKTISDSDLA